MLVFGEGNLGPVSYISTTELQAMYPGEGEGEVFFRHVFFFFSFFFQVRGLFLFIQSDCPSFHL